MKDDVIDGESLYRVSVRDWILQARTSQNVGDCDWID